MCGWLNTFFYTNRIKDIFHLLRSEAVVLAHTTHLAKHCYLLKILSIGINIVRCRVKMDFGTPLTGMLKCLSHCHSSVRYEALTPLDLFKVFLTLIFKGSWDI